MRDRAPAELRDFSASPPGDLHWTQVRERLAFVAHRLRRFSGNAYLRDVELPAAIEEEHLLAARNARNPHYARMAAFYDFYASVVERPDWARWTEVLRQSAILGYLLAGTLVGPNVLGLVGEAEHVRTIAELGVALLLFTIGLEFSFRRLRRLGRMALMGGTLQRLYGARDLVLRPTPAGRR